MTTSPTPTRPEPVREDFIDFPTAWRIQREGVTHTSVLCSAVHADGALLCDCGAVEDEWKRRVLAQQGVPDDAPRPDAPRPEPVVPTERIPCERCGATGAAYGAQEPCPDCNGFGWSPRPEPVATADLILDWRADAASMPREIVMEWGDRLAKALEDTKAERDRAHATLRRIDSKATGGIGTRYPRALVGDLGRLARERLENP